MIITTAVLIYSISSQLNNLSLIGELGELNFEFLSISAIVRSFDISLRSQTPVLLTVEYLQSTLTSLVTHRDTLMSFYDTQIDCQGSEIKNSDTIPYWAIDNGNLTFHHSNMQDFIDAFIKRVSKI